MNAPRQQSSSRTTRFVVVGIALTVLLGVVALVSRGHTSPAGSGAHDRGASQGLANIVFTIWVLAMIVGVGMLAYTMSIKKRDTKREEFRIKPLLFSLLFFAAVVISMVFLYNHLGQKAPPQKINPAALGTKKLKKGKGKLQEPATPHRPSFNWYVAGGLFAVVFAASLTALIASQRRRSKLVREITVAQELLTMLDETLDDLRNEADPRKAVIAAYARMEKILSAHGLARRPSEAPLEYLRRVMTELHVSEDAVTKLTALFERAKFSEHEIGPDAKEEAIAALVELRDQLRVINEPREKPALLPERIPGKVRGFT